MWNSERLSDRVNGRITQKEKDFVLQEAKAKFKGNESQYIRYLIRQQMKIDKEERDIEAIVLQFLRKHQGKVTVQESQEATSKANQTILKLFGGVS